ncbi:hypothetical protein ACIA8C_26855 [Nocardia sp. NPDC051321]|uniref:Gp37-like protein n=1 Tax=Nocardia sp. NPDC051321 TaxID=3364323 RepID=UPI003796B3DB
MSVDLDSMSLAQQCEAIWDATLAAERADDLDRLAQPLVRLWDGHWRLAGIICSEYRAEFTWVDNDTGTALVEIPLSDPLARWVWRTRARIEAGEGRNIHITCDKPDGTRWSGHLHDHSIERRADGSQVLTLRFVHDFQHLKAYLIWSNPFFGPEVQIPRTFGPIPGPARWALKLPLLLNVMREQMQQHGWHLPDDPLDPASWLGAVGLDMSDWSVVVVPTSFAEDLAAGTLWAVPHSRFKYWFDMARDILEDAELSVRCRRWLEGDPPPWPGAPRLRHGVLVIDIVNSSGFYSDTSSGGNPFDGLARTVARFSEDFIDTIVEPIVDPVTPADYLIPGRRRTDVTTPFVVYFDSPETGIETSKFTETAATAVQVVTGGQSMPGVAGAPLPYGGGAPAIRPSRRGSVSRHTDGRRSPGRRHRPAARRGRHRRFIAPFISRNAAGLACGEIQCPRTELGLVETVRVPRRLAGAGLHDRGNDGPAQGLSRYTSLVLSRDHRARRCALRHRRGRALVHR